MVYAPKHLRRFNDNSRHSCANGCAPMDCVEGCCGNNKRIHNSSCPSSATRQLAEMAHDLYVESGSRKHLAEDISGSILMSWNDDTSSSVFLDPFPPFPPCPTFDPPAPKRSFRAHKVSPTSGHTDSTSVTIRPDIPDSRVQWLEKDLSDRSRLRRWWRRARGGNFKDV